MKTYQNLILIILILVGIIVKSYSQSTSLNWTFFIDGKIPETVQCSMVLSQDNKKDTIRVDYVPGEMLISQGNYDKITNSSCENIVLDFSCYAIRAILLFTVIIKSHFIDFYLINHMSFSI